MKCTVLRHFFNFFSLLTMPPQGQTQGLSYKDQDQDLGGKDQGKDKDKDNNTASIP